MRPADRTTQNSSTTTHAGKRGSEEVRCCSSSRSWAVVIVGHVRWGSARWRRATWSCTNAWRRWTRCILMKSLMQTLLPECENREGRWVTAQWVFLTFARTGKRRGMRARTQEGACGTARRDQRVRRSALCPPPPSLLLVCRHSSRPPLRSPSPPNYKITNPKSYTLLH